MKKFFNEMNPMLRNLLTGVVVYGIIVGMITSVILLVWFPKNFGYGMVCYILGIAYAILQLVHMYQSLVVTLDYREEKGATWHARKMYAIRLLVALIIFALAWFLGKAYGLLFTMLGMTMLKVAAYLQPITDKMLQKFK